MSNYNPKYLGMDPKLKDYLVSYIRMYDHFKEMADALLENGVGINMDGQPHGTNTSDPTAITAERREKYLQDIRIIEDSIVDACRDRKGEPQVFFQTGIWQQVKEGRHWREIDGYYFASEKTWWTYKQRFLHEVAIRKGLIQE